MIRKLFNRIFLVLLLASLGKAHAQQPQLYASVNSAVTLQQDAQRYEVVKLLKDLEKQFNVVFDYNKKSLKGKTMTLRQEQLRIKNVDLLLNTILPPHGMQFKKYNDHSYMIFLSNEPPPAAGQKDEASSLTFPTNSLSEENAGTSRGQGNEFTATVHSISGTVTDEDGQTMPGVNVVVKNTRMGTTTDSHGKYSLDVEDENATLVFSFIGFVTQEVAINSRTVIDLTLVVDVNTLSEVVVVGYGTVKKRDLTGSVYSVKSADIVVTPTHNAVEALQGRVPGMDVVRTSGAPGSGTDVVIRGNKSITARDKLVARNSPLYVVDGYQMPQGSSINDINPNDIESIDVLKDASATAIYGAMGANGVVIVTTKKGKEGDVKVSYNSYYGINYYTFPESRIGEDYLNLRREAWRTTNEWSSPADDATIFPDAGEWEAVQQGQWVDWVDLAMHNGRQTSHTLSLIGGTQKTKVFTSLGYFREDGMLKDNDYSRYNIRVNLDQEINTWIKIGTVSQITYSVQNDRKDPLSLATSISPLGIPYDENGVVNTYPVEFDKTKISPLADEKNNYIAKDNTIRANVLANGYLELAPVKGLTFRSNFGANLSFSRRGIYQDKESLARENTKTTNTSSESAFARFINWDNVLTYSTQFSLHSVTAMALTSYLRSDQDNTKATGSNQIAQSQIFHGLNGTVPATMEAPYVGWKNIAYAGRLNYSYNGKYLLTVTGRYDGASRLAPGHKWQFFPSVAVGWNIKDESFMSELNAVDQLKIRGSYGVSGNYAIDVYGTQSGLYPGRNMSFGDVAAPMYQFNPLIGNPDLGWETSATFDVGLDVAALQNRITASVDLYKTKTSDILMQRTLPQSTGVASVYQNIAETENKGIEVSITSLNIKINSFQWTTTLTYASNREEITELIDGRDIIKNERESLLLGRPINSFYTYDKLGIWQTSEADVAGSYKANSATGNPFQPGDIKVRDINGDFIISADSDRVYVGSAVPKGVIGFQNNFTYKGFDLGIFIFARYGQTIDAQFLGRYNPSGNGNGPAFLDYWTPENPTNDYPRPRKNTSLSTYTGYTGYQALNFVNGSFVKVRNITLGYTLPEAWTQKIRINRLRVYTTGSNLFIKAKSHLIQDYDPERGGSESSPLSRTLVFGLNVDF